MTTKLGKPVDFKKIQLFPRRYLDTYYRNVNDDEVHISNFLIEKGRALATRHLNAIEIGCGPTVHHALSMAPYVASIDMADYLPDNLAEIQKWQEHRPDAFSWHHYTKMVLEQEGEAPTTTRIRDRENILREKIQGFYTCDITKSLPLDKVGPYPIVMSFYCAEEVGTSHAKWEEVMNNISTMVAAEGHFLLSALRETSSYILGDPQGAHEWLPCAPITAELLQKCLNGLGFIPESIDIRSVDTPSLSDLGIPGILMAAAKKP